MEQRVKEIEHAMRSQIRNKYPFSDIPEREEQFLQSGAIERKVREMDAKYHNVPGKDQAARDDEAYRLLFADYNAIFAEV